MIGGGVRLWFSIDHWVGVSEYVAVGFASVDGYVQVPVSLVVYAPLTAERLRDLNMGDLTSVESHWPRWEGSEPPSPDVLRNRWIRLVVLGQREDVEYARAEPREQKILKRQPGQDPDEFYAEVARLYRAFGATTGKPTTSIAKAAAVSRNTAAQWVYHARKRGHLSAAERGE